MSHRFLLPLFIAAVIAPSALRGQSIPESSSRMKNAQAWPQPIRHLPTPAVEHQPVEHHAVKHRAPAPEPPFHGGLNHDVIPVNELRSPIAAPPHRIIRSPHVQAAAEEREKSIIAAHKAHLARLHKKRPGPPPPAMMPNANFRNQWKSPYSYGYFGASSTRQWSLHYGYRDRSTEWRLH